MGGKGGGGGDAGYGGAGGAGGAGGSVLNDQVSGAGTGGDGGDGNDGGNGGNGGDGGSAVGALYNLGAVNVAGAALLYFDDASAGSAGTGGNEGGIGGAGDGGAGGYNGLGFGSPGSSGEDGGSPGKNGNNGAAGTATPYVQQDGSVSGTLTIEDQPTNLVGAAYFTFAQTQPQAAIIQLSPTTTSVTFTYEVDMVGDTADGGSVEWTVVGPSQSDFAGHVNSGTLSFSSATGAIYGFNGIEGSFSFTLDVDPSVPEKDFSVVLSNPGGLGTQTSPQGILGASISLEQTVNGGNEPTPTISGIASTPPSGGTVGLGG